MTRKRYETPNGLLHAAKELGIDDASFRQLPGWRAEDLLDPMLDTFTKQGSQNRQEQWIWNDLRDPHAFLQKDKNLLLEFGSPATAVWLVTEDWWRRKRGPPFWLFEGTLGAVSATLDNHHLLEFFVVSRGLTWLVGQNHHEIWFAVGDAAVENLRRLSG